MLLFVLDWIVLGSVADIAAVVVGASVGPLPPPLSPLHTAPYSTVCRGAHVYIYSSMNASRTWLHTYTLLHYMTLCLRTESFHSVPPADSAIARRIPLRERRRPHRRTHHHRRYVLHLYHLVTFVSVTFVPHMPYRLL